MSNFMKIHPVAAELFRADGQTDTDGRERKLTVTCHNYARAAKNIKFIGF